MKSIIDKFKEEWEKRGVDAELMLKSLILQWEASGLDPDEMLNQLEQVDSTDMTWELDYLDVDIDEEAIYDNSSIEDNEEELIDVEDPFMDWENDTIKYNKASTSSYDIFKAVACGALQAFNHETYLNTLSTGVSKEEAQSILNKWWQISDSKSLEESLNLIAEKGHRTEWDCIWEQLSKTASETWEEEELDILDEIDENNSDIDILSCETYLSNIIDVFPFISSYLDLNEKSLYTIQAWDYGRAINLCRWGYDAGYLTQKEAEIKIQAFANEIFKKYKSWEQVSTSFILGASMWSGNIDTVNDLLHSHYVLFNNSQSPWQLIDF